MLDDIIVVTRGDRQKHATKLFDMLNRLEKAEQVKENRNSL